MALPPPLLAELGTFRGEDYAPGTESDQAEMVLQQATDALWIYTGLEDYPADQRNTRVIKNAIMEMTLWLVSQYEHRDEINSPFSSERIGSYSYSKMQQASTGKGSGLFWLDMLFKMLNGTDLGSLFSVTSERVFNPEGYTYEEQAYVDRFTLHDPSTESDVFGGWSR